MRFKVLLFILLCLCSIQPVLAQDTVRVTLEEFIKKGVQHSGKIDAERQKVLLAKNQIDQVQDKRYLPTFNLTTVHGLVPNTEGDSDDSNAFQYNFEDLSLYTQARIELLQPIFTWGALRNAVQASRDAAEAAISQFEVAKDQIKLRLYKLYQSYLFSLAVGRLLDEAQHKIDVIGKQIEEKKNEKESEIDQSEIFKFKVFKAEFAIRAAEVKESAKYIQNVWNYVLDAPEGTICVPKDRFLDPVQNTIKELAFYKSSAIQKRPELQALEAGIDAAGHALEATKSKNYPALFFGIRGVYIYTPNPPREDYAISINDHNYISGSIGIGIRQNLDFWSMKYDVRESRLKYQQIKFSKDAAIDGIILQINQKYKDASLSSIKVEKTDEALVTSKKWLRQEQLNYDLGIGDTKDLIDAIKKELELQVQLKQQIFNFNKNMAELYNVSALPVSSLTTKYSIQ